MDLGAAPGGWTQIVVEKTGPEGSDGKVVAIDIQEMEPLAGAESLVLDICASDAPARLRAALGGTADVVLSDMAAAVTGHKSTDHLRTWLWRRSARVRYGNTGGRRDAGDESLCRRRAF